MAQSRNNVTTSWVAWVRLKICRSKPLFEAKPPFFDFRMCGYVHFLDLHWLVCYKIIFNHVALSSQFVNSSGWWLFGLWKGPRNNTQSSSLQECFSLAAINLSSDFFKNLIIWECLDMHAEYSSLCAGNKHRPFFKKCVCVHLCTLILFLICGSCFLSQVVHQPIEKENLIRVINAIPSVMIS